MTAPKISNPLTIVGIFASVTEVGGTAVLPLLDPGTQALYIWFLILFPIVLLLLFFATLWFRPSSLYSPEEHGGAEDFREAIRMHLHRDSLRGSVLDAIAENPDLYGRLGQSTDRVPLPDAEEKQS